MFVKDIEGLLDPRLNKMEQAQSDIMENMKQLAENQDKILKSLTRLSSNIPENES